MRGNHLIRRLAVGSVRDERSTGERQAGKETKNIGLIVMVFLSSITRNGRLEERGGTIVNKEDENKGRKERKQKGAQRTKKEIQTNSKGGLLRRLIHHQKYHTALPTLLPGNKVDSGESENELVLWRIKKQKKKKEERKG